MAPVVCHVCGRQFGTHGFQFHLPKCEELWLSEQMKVPKSKRKPIPKAPDLGLLDNNLPNNHATTHNSRSKQMQQQELYNEQAMRTFNEQTLQTCPNCLRTFTDKAMISHSKSCKVKLDKSKIPEYRQKRSTTGTPPESMKSDSSSNQISRLRGAHRGSVSSSEMKEDRRFENLNNNGDVSNTNPRQKTIPASNKNFTSTTRKKGEKSSKDGSSTRSLRSPKEVYVESAPTTDIEMDSPTRFDIIKRVRNHLSLNDVEKRKYLLKVLKELEGEH